MWWTSQYRHNAFNFHRCYGRKPYFRGQNKPFKPRRMRGLLNLLSFLFTTGLFIAGAFYFIAKIIGQIAFDPNSSAWKKTVQKLQDKMRSLAAGALVPWDGEMLSLLSFNRTKVKKPGFWNSSSEGIFTTIYQEPVVAYAGLTSGKTAVFAARTSTKEFIFRQKEKETEIWINNTPFAVYASGALLAAGRGSRLLASLEYDAAEAQWPLMIGDKAAAAINNPARAESLGPNPRSVTLLRKLTQEEEDAVLALAIMFAIRG